MEYVLLKIKRALFLLKFENCQTKALDKAPFVSITGYLMYFRSIHRCYGNMPIEI